MKKRGFDAADSSGRLVEPVGDAVKHFLRLARASGPNESASALFRRAQQRAGARLVAYTRLDRGHRA